MFLKHEEQQEPLNISPCNSINLSVVPISSCQTLPPFPQKIYVYYHIVIRKTLFWDELLSFTFDDELTGFLECFFKFLETTLLKKVQLSFGMNCFHLPLMTKWQGSWNVFEILGNNTLKESVLGLKSHRPNVPCWSKSTCKNGNCYLFCKTPKLNKKSRLQPLGFKRK